MADLVIKGAQPYDGHYPFNLEQFSTHEWGWIKRFSGYLPLTLDEAAYGDPEFICVLGVIALHRAGKIERAEVPDVFDRVAAAPFGETITLETDEADEAGGGDAGPPVTSSNGSSDTNGDGSPTSSETSAQNQPGSGIPGSASSVSDRPTLVT